MALTRSDFVGKIYLVLNTGVLFSSNYGIIMPGNIVLFVDITGSFVGISNVLLHVPGTTGLASLSWKNFGETHDRFLREIT